VDCGQPGKKGVRPSRQLRVFERAGKEAKSKDVGFCSVAEDWRAEEPQVGFARMFIFFKGRVNGDLLKFYRHEISSCSIVTQSTIS
jgi:hypothetical protein